MPLRVSRHNLLIGIVAAAFFMQNLDGTVITTALPQMAVTFDTTPIHLSIGITAYILSLAVFIPVSGWFSDRFGRAPFSARRSRFSPSARCFAGSATAWSNLPSVVSFRAWAAQ